MIRIIKGTYGRVKDGVVEAMTPRSAPFSLTESREAELIAAGVAEKAEQTLRTDECVKRKSTEPRTTAAAPGKGRAGRKKEIPAVDGPGQEGQDGGL